MERKVFLALAIMLGVFFIITHRAISIFPTNPEASVVELGFELALLWGFHQTENGYQITEGLRFQLQKKRNPFDLPNSVEKFRKWQKAYSIIKPMIDQQSKEGKKSRKQIITFIQINHIDLPSDEKTIRKIIKAGDAGCLDFYPPDWENYRRKEDELENNRKSGNSQY